MNPYIDLSNVKIVESEDRTDSDFSNQFKKNVINEEDEIMSMEINNNYYAFTTSYTNTTNNVGSTTVTTKSFTDEVQNAEKTQCTTIKSNSSAWAGDIVISYPPNYSNFTYDSSISNKSKEEMTMDEYKQWVMNEMSQMPVSGWVRSTYSSGATVIKEEAFERMKSDPEYENYVLNRVRSAYSVQSLPVGSNNASYDVIGASPEECYGYAGPVGKSGLETANEGENWWQKRHDELEELLAKQTEAAMKKAQVRREQEQQEYLASQLASQQRLQSFLMEKMQSGQDITDVSTLQSVNVPSSAVSAYENAISTYSNSLLENI
jgi:hypothetical protein